MAESPAPVDAEPSSADALVYWRNVDATVDGMLGGFPQVSRIDLRSSRTFLTKLRRPAPNNRNTPNATSPKPPAPPPLGRVLDCGAGVGRITSGFLAHVAATVDMVEPVEKFAAEARALKMLADPAVAEKIGDVFVAGLQDWAPPRDRAYDLIWHQWCLGHLTDEQVVAWLERCQRVLSTGGWIVVKENLSTDREGRDMFDKLDSSVTRTDRSFREIFEQAGLKVAMTELQKGFPRGLMPVRMYALRPK